MTSKPPVSPPVAPVSEEKQKFFQFPIGILAFGPDELAKCKAIVAFGAISAGVAKEAELGNGVTEAIEALRGKTWTDCDLSQWDHRAWALGTPIVGYGWTDNPEYCLGQYRPARKFLDGFGKSPLVRVPRDLVEELDKQKFEFRDFSVIAAVYAVIGEKQYAIVRRDRVRAGALGYGSARDLFDLDGNLTPEGEVRLRKREDGARPATVDQVRYTLKRLHDRKFFSRIQPTRCGREVFYSRSLDHDTLADRLLNRIKRKSESDLAQDSAQAKLREKAAPLLKRGTPGEKPAPAPACHSPDSPRNVPGSSPENPRFNTCSLNKCSPNTFSSNSCTHIGNGESESRPASKKKKSKRDKG